MFGKGYFEGDFRTKPIVNNRGATKAENKEQLLERARLDRQNREVGAEETQLLSEPYRKEWLII